MHISVKTNFKMVEPDSITDTMLKNNNKYDGVPETQIGHDVYFSNFN